MNNELGPEDFVPRPAKDQTHRPVLTAEMYAVVQWAVRTYEETAELPRDAWVLPELRDAIVAYLAPDVPSS